jgi:hypothetical protein
MDIRAIDPRTTQPLAPAPAPAAPAAPAEAASATAAPADFVEINVPMRIPTELVTPDANGNTALSQYQPKLLPADAIITNEAEVKTLVDSVRKQALPDGTHPEINMTADGKKVEAAKNTIVKLASSAGSLGVYSLMVHHGGLFTIPHAFAAPFAVVGGAIGVLSGLDQAKEALNLKGYYQSLKAQGVESVPMQIPVRTKDGQDVETRDVPTADLVKGARDTAIVGGMQSLAGALMCAAGLGGGPVVALASVVVTAGSALYAARGQFAAVAKACWSKIASHFHKQPEQQPQPSQQPQAPAAQAQPIAPEQAIVPLGKPAPPPSVNAPDQPTELYLSGEQPRSTAQAGA